MGEEDEAERVALVDEEGEPAAADPGRRGPGLWPFGGRKGRRPQYVELSDSLGSGELDGEADLAPEGTPRGRWCPEEEAGWVSRTGFFWVSGLLQKGSEKHLEADDLWDYARGDDARAVAARFQELYEGTQGRGSKAALKTRIFRTLVKAHGATFARAGLLKLVHDALMLSGPLLLRMLLQHEQAGGGRGKGAALAGAMAVAALAQALMINRYFHTLYRISMHVKCEMVTMVYGKALALSGAALGELSAGKIQNLQSNDASKIWGLPNYLHIIWSGPLQIVTIMLMLSLILGAGPSFAGLGMTIVMIPVGAVVGKKLAKLRKELVSHTDARIKCTSEVISGIKAIKLYAWEDPYLKKVKELRETELRWIRRTAVYSIANSIIYFSTPILVSLAAFVAYSLLGHELTADKAFPALALFNLLRFPILVIPMQIQNLINGSVSLKRMQAYMDAEEAAPNPPAPSGAVAGDAITLEKADFAWGAAEGAAEGAAPVAVLKNVSLRVPRGQLVMVVGTVGSGKSSLLAGLLGELVCSHGGCTVAGSRAFTAQEPWIQNATVRQNIVAGAPFEEEKYRRVIEACALGSDLELLPAGDESEIGEKGINLSGGQRHRVALARAVYAAADVYLLDDPLSAVDAHVGKHLFERCICGALAGTTRVLVTHQTQFAESADFIYVLEDGMVAHAGTYSELQARGVSLSFLKEEGEEEEAAPGKPAAGKGKITKAEERAKGRVKREVYLAYFFAWGPYLLFPTLVLSMALLERGLQVGQNAWLAVWSDATQVDGSWAYVRYYLAVYALLGVSSLGLQGVKAVFLIQGSINSSRTLHANILEKLFRLPMSFFESQPTGRLLNRFTNDTEKVDTAISSSLNSALACVVSAACSLAVVVAVTPTVVVALAPVGYLYYRVQALFIAAQREIKRLDSLAMSPIFGLFAESLRGVATIRAFGFQDSLRAKNFGLVNASNRAYWPLVSSNRWLSVRLEFVGALTVFGTAMTVAILTHHGPGLAGLAITSALNLTGLMAWMVRQTTELEVNMNSVERIVEYDAHAPEAPAVLPGKRPPAGWPGRGQLVVRDLSVRYRAGLAPVLRGVSFRVEAGQKVGICGRTGCGKSTLMMALYRIVEPCGGSVEIDGLDTGAIGLFDLRSRLALVPQEPVLFTGTIRSNLDPFGAAPGDHALWAALEQSGLKPTVAALEGGLDSPVTEGGANLSVGQRQLLCMARALLRQSRILLLDEATSNVDNETDAVIQRTIRTAFRDCTVLTIAHRLHTIADSDRILVLEQGRVAEFDAPDALLRREGGLYAALVGDAGGMRRSASGRTLTSPSVGAELNLLG